MPKQSKFTPFLSAVAAIAVMGPVSAQTANDADGLPDAKSGECYAKVLVPPQYDTETFDVVVTEPAEKIQIVPASFTNSTERVLVKEASTILKAVEPVFETTEQKILVTAASTRWVKDSVKSDIGASPGLLSDLESSGLKLASASPGACFYEHYRAPTISTREERVMVKQATESLSVVPAKFANDETKVMSRPASTRILEVPVIYKTVQDRVLVEPEKSVWKKGTGLVQRIDNTTGEIMCRVDLPAVYENYSKRIVDSPARTSTVNVPAEFTAVKISKVLNPAREVRSPVNATYKSVKKRTMLQNDAFTWLPSKAGGTDESGKHTGNVVCLKETPAVYETVVQTVVKSPGRFERTQVPAVYESVKVSKLVTDATSNIIVLPEQRKQFSKRRKVSSSKLEWREVLCETNLSETRIKSIQRALNDKGYNSGSIDGVIGSSTYTALEKFQQDKNLPLGGLTFPTLDALGVKL